MLPHFDLVARGLKSGRKGDVYLAVGDFSDISDVFQELQIQSVPVIYRYSSESPTGEEIQIREFGTNPQVANFNRQWPSIY